jgi:metallo-beta-lactamase family protein
MQISFHGAAGTVTGSKHLLTLATGTQVLLDCGLFQGMGKDTLKLNTSFGFNPAQVSYVLLSHAHIDHTGLLPKLVKEGFKGPIYCTPATAELAEIMLMDSAHIQESDVQYINKKKAKKGEPLIKPLYTKDDVYATIALFKPVHYNTITIIDNNIAFYFTDTGHILGSAAIHLSVQENGHTTKLTFSGDIGRYNDALLQSPTAFEQQDVIIMESTYGDSLHQEFTNTEETLLQHITNTCINKKGHLIIPAFSVGRTQELLYALNCLEEKGLLPAVKYFVDSPLSVRVTEITKKHAELFNKTVHQLMLKDAYPFDFKGLTYINTKDESMALNSYAQPCVIMSASGMADAGRIKHHIANKIHDSRHTILMVGYCSPGSLGGQLLAGNKEVKIYTEYYAVQAEVQSMRSMSAHGDYDDLLQFIANQNPQLVKHLFLVHGEPDVQMAFKNKLAAKGYNNVVLPKQHEVFNV